jgi:Na+/phosphate symporter
VIKVSKILQLSYTSFFKEKHKELKHQKKEAKHLSKDIKAIRDGIPEKLKKFEESDLESGHHYVQVVAYLKEMSNSLMHIIQPAYNHLDNNHPLDKMQAEPLKIFNEKSSEFFNFAIKILKNREFESIDELAVRRDKMIELANDIMLTRIKILKKTQKGVKVSVTYMEMLNETKNLFLNVVHLVRADARMQESMEKVHLDIELDILD